MIFYRAMYDHIVFLDQFQNQYIYLSWTDTLDTLTDQFAHQYVDLSFRDQLFFTDTFHVVPLNIHFKDTLNLVDSFKNIKFETFTDVLNLIDIWNPAVLEDTLKLTDSFLAINATSFGDDLILTDEFIISGTYSIQFSDILELDSFFVYYIMPTTTHCP